MKVIDLSKPIASLSTPMFPGYPQPLRAKFATFEEKGYEANVWLFVEHTSTHVDAPAHFVKGGKTIDEIPVDTFVGWATAIDLSHKGPKQSITKEDVANGIRIAREKGVDFGRGWILLIYTGYGEKEGTPQWLEHPGLDEGACRYLLEIGVKAVGTDAPSPDREPYPAHSILLANGVAIYENLANLDKVLYRKFLFVAPPLKLVKGTGSPVRAVAILFED